MEATLTLLPFPLAPSLARVTCGDKMTSAQWERGPLADDRLPLEGALAVVQGSRLRCAETCWRHDSCLSFFHNAFSRDCRVFGQTEGLPLAPAPGFLQFTVRCPSELGYVRIAKGRLCLRAVRLPRHQLQASAHCQQEGGHLVTLETPEKWAAVRAFLSSEGLQNERVYVDGGDKHTKSVWMWRNCQAFSFRDWGSGEATWNTDQNCVCVSRQVD